MKHFDMPAQTRLKITKTTPRKETHGKELVQAVSLRVEWWPTDNGAVNLLHEGLQDLLWWVPPEAAAQASLEGVQAVKKHRRVPTLHMPLKIEAAFSGYTCTIEHGIDETTELELYACSLDKFELEAKEGGSVVIRWSLATNKQVTSQLVGLLCGLEGTEVVATLTPPAVTEGDAIDGSKGHPGAAASKAAEDDRQAGLAFGEAHAGGDADPDDEGAGASDQHAGDFGTADEADLAAEAERGGEGWPLEAGETGPVDGAQGAASNDAASNDAAELEAGMSKAIAAAGLQPKAARRPRRAAGGAVE